MKIDAGITNKVSKVPDTTSRSRTRKDNSKQEFIDHCSGTENIKNNIEKDKFKEKIKDNMNKVKGEIEELSERTKNMMIEYVNGEWDVNFDEVKIG